MFLATTDFTGFYQVSNGNAYQDDKINTYIADAQPKFLRDLLGCTLYDLFIADLVNDVPQTQRFIDIFDAFCTDDGNTNGTQYKSDGIKAMLKGFTYYNIVRDSDFFNTISGNVKNTFSNSLSVTDFEAGTNERYNVALGTYQVIQWYICDNASVYPEYNGMDKEVVTMFSI